MHFEQFFLEFEKPVHFKDQEGKYLEEVAHQNHWGVAVREISSDRFQRITDLAGAIKPSSTEIDKDIIEVGQHQLKLPPINEAVRECLVKYGERSN